MKKNVDKVLIDIRTDEPLKEVIREGSDPVDFTLRSAIMTALLGTFDGDKATPDKKAKRFDVAMKIKASGDVDLTTDDLSIIKEITGIVYNPNIVGQINRWADSDNEVAPTPS